MAIDKNRVDDIINELDKVLGTLTSSTPGIARKYLKKTIMGPAIDEVRRLIQDSRPPVLFMVGRSGHGKSSVINALANRSVAEIGDIKPTTPETIPYEINFTDRFAVWQVIDSRGIFEATRPGGAAPGNAVKILEQDIVKYRPDIIMHVISAPEIRNMSQDLEVFRQIYNYMFKTTGIRVPTVMVINKADTLGNPREWPPEEAPRKASLVKEALDYLTIDVLGVKQFKKLDLNNSLRGYAVIDDTYLGIIPTCALSEDLWNIETLSYFIGDHIPENTLLDFYQAQNRKEALKRISTKIIKRFSQIAGGIGASPIPIADFAILTPLQLLMVMIIGGLSCRDFNKETAKEYLTAAGLNVGAAFGFRSLAHQLAKFIPFAGWAISGTIASAATYALGKSAEAYFFSGVLKKPEEYIN